MTDEKHKSYAEKNEERIERAIDKIEEKLTDDDKKNQSTSSKSKPKQ